MVRNKISRFAFTMIELIFAIVVIAVAVLSLPVMSQITARGMENSIVQEAIFAASGELMGATSYYWDENSLEDIATSQLSRVIDLPGNNCDTDRLMPGHIAQPFHRRCLDSNTTLPTDASDGGIPDLDDAAITQDIFTDTDTEAEGYKLSYQSAISVSRNGNVKTITSTITDKASGDTVVVLRTQSANVGEVDYYKRRF